MRFQIKKILEGYDPAELIEQSMYCFGSDGSEDTSDSLTDADLDQIAMDADQLSNERDRGREDTTDSLTATDLALADARSGGSIGQDIGLSAFGGQGGGMSNQATAGIQSALGDMAGGSLREIDPITGQRTTFSPMQVPDLELMPKVPYDIFGMQNRVNKILEDRDKQGLYTQVTRDELGNVTGAFNNAPMFGLGFLPNVRTYTGLDQNPYNEDRRFMDSGNDEQVVAPTRNPVSGQPVCPDGYRFDDDLQACRLDTSRPNNPNNPNPFPSGDAYYRATSLDNAPMNVPSGFDFNKANQDFVSQFAYRPANFTNQMNLSGFTPFKRS